MKIPFFILLTFFASPLLAHSVKPGIWRAETAFELNGIPMPNEVIQECVSKTQASDLKATIAKDLKEKGCELTDWNVKGQKLAAALKCRSGEIQATGNLSGELTDKRYDLKGQARGTWNTIPTTATVKLTGKWVSDCK